MPIIDRKAIEHVAKLASLSLDDAEADKLTRDLASIVKYVEELGAIDTSKVEPTASVQLGPTAWREDVAVPGLSNEEALGGAPRAADGGFAVPVFVSTEERRP
jgi:aspartyl-tRNA(Asn)/glutamyl-tRNA(Gln) amidotransferase subunit C